MPEILTCEPCTAQVFEELDTVAEAQKLPGTNEEQRKAALSEPRLRAILAISPSRRAVLQRLRLLGVWAVEAFKAIKDPANADRDVAAIIENFSIAWAATQGRYGLLRMAQMEAIDLVHTAKLIIERDGCPPEQAARWVVNKFAVRFHDVAVLENALVAAAIDGWVVAEGRAKNARRDFKAIVRMLHGARLIPKSTTSRVIRSTWLRWRREFPGSQWEDKLPALGSKPPSLTSNPLRMPDESPGQ